MTLEKRQEWYRLAACPAATGVVLLVILLPLSFQYVKYNEIAFVKKRTSGTISRDNVYTSGRHFLGPDIALVTFPASAVTVEYPGLGVWTKSERQTETAAGAAGTAVNIDISFQYQLRPTELSDLYDKVALAYAPFIENVANTAIKNTTTSFTAEEWTQNRAKIQAALFESVDAALDQANADCVSLQLGYVKFPQTYIDRMLAAAVQIQSNQAEESRQQSKLIRDTTDQKVKFVENDANLITQTAAAKASLILTKAKSRVQAENNKAELFLLEAALTRKQTEKEVAALTNDAMKVLQVAEANANKTKAVAENTLMETVDRARAQGLKNISQTLADHGVNLEAKHKASLDYMIKVIEAGENVESFIGMPTNLMLT